MEYLASSKVRPICWLIPALALLLVLAVACGSAAAPAAETTAPEPAAPAPAQKSEPSAPAPVEPAAAEKTAPTAVPEAKAEPKEAMTVVEEVHPGKVRLMIGNWGNERFDPAHFVGANNNYLRLTEGFLIETNEKTELIPGMATDWVLSEDGKTWTFTIREGVKFHNGKELTAEDVLWSWLHQWSEEAQEYATGLSAQSQSRRTEKIELTGPDQVSLTTTFPDSSFGRYISASGPSTYHNLPAGYGGLLTDPDPVHPTVQLYDQEAEAAFDKNPAGTGPLDFVKGIPSERMEMERFDDYYFQPDNGFYEDRRMKFTSLDLFLVPEEATRVAALRADEADIAPVSLVAKEQLEASGGRLIFGREGIYFRIFLAGCWHDPDNPFPCDDKRVRQALDYAIDKDVMRDRLFGGPEVMETKGWAAVTPSTIGYSPELDPWPFDPDKARQLLAEAGYKTPDNPDGKDFGKLIINTWPSASMPFLPESAQLAAENLRRELGIDADVRVGEEAGLKKALKAQKLHGQILWRDNEARIDAASISRSSYGTLDYSARVSNDPEVAKVVQDALAVFDPDKLEETWNEVYLRLRDESYELGIGYINIPWGVGPNILEWQPYPLAFYPSGVHTLTLK
jgi:peptide/nickel transport system substrate-binding protein